LLSNRHVFAGIQLDSQFLARTIRHPLFYVLACYATGDAADHGCHLLTGSATDFITKQAADQCACTGTHGTTVIALNRDIRGMSDNTHFDAISALGMALL
jgi:hypothetical protein